MKCKITLPTCRKIEHVYIITVRLKQQQINIKLLFKIYTTVKFIRQIITSTLENVTSKHYMLFLFEIYAFTTQVFTKIYYDQSLGYITHLTKKILSYLSIFILSLHMVVLNIIQLRLMDLKVLAL